MKLPLILIALLFFLPSCSSLDVSDYSNNKPEFDLYEYFTGEVKGWGIVQNRKGKLVRQFVVAINGTINEENELILDEQFSWSDGEKTSRTWTISRIGEKSFVGKAGDVVGSAVGAAAGNALNWKYVVNLDVDSSTWKIGFDDWMFLQADGVLLNKASMYKFGLRVGDVTISFHKAGGL